jgi:hypothetical protein
MPIIHYAAYLPDGSLDFALDDDNKIRHQVWACDALGLIRAKEITAERGSTAVYQEKPMPELFLDLGGMICTDDPNISVTIPAGIGGNEDEIKIGCPAIHVDTILSVLKRGCTFTDCPHLSKLPCWGGMRVMVSTALAQALIPALEAKQVEASRLADLSFTRRERVMAEINKDGVKVLMAPRSHHPLGSDN